MAKIDEAKLLEKLRQIRKEWSERYDMEGVAGYMSDDILDLIWGIKTGKFDTRD